LIDGGDNGLHTEHVAADDEALQHVDLSSFDFIVLVLFIPESIIQSWQESQTVRQCSLKSRMAQLSNLPVLIEPVVNLGLGVNGVSEVGGSGRGNPELLLVCAEHVVDQLFVLSLVVVLDDTKVSDRGA
jgi:hypothetical protein